MKVKNSVKHISIYAIGLLSSKLVSLLMLPIVTSLLKPDDFGTLEILQTLSFLLGTIFCCGIGDAIFRFGGTAKTNQQILKICQNALSLILIVNLILCVLIMAFSHQLAHILPGNITFWQVRYVSIAVLANCVFIIPMSFLRLREDTTAYISFSFIFTILLAVLVLIALYLGYGVTGMMFVSAVANVIICLLIIIFYVKLKPLFIPKWQKILFFYGLPLVFSGMAEFTILWLPGLWLSYTIKLADFALFALAMKFSLITSVLMTPFTLWWFPNRFKQIGTSAGKLQCARITEAGVALSFIFALGIALASSVFIKLFIKESYHAAINYLAPLCFMFAIKNAGELMNTGVYLKKTSQAMIINNVCALMTVIALYFFIPLWHIWGVIFALIMIFTFRWFCFAYLSQKEIFLPYRYLRLAIFTIIIILSLIVIYMFSNLSDYLFRGTLLMVFILIFAFYFEFIPKFYVKGKIKL